MTCALLLDGFFFFVIFRSSTPSPPPSLTSPPISSCGTVNPSIDTNTCFGRGIVQKYYLGGHNSKDEGEKKIEEALSASYDL